MYNMTKLFTSLHLFFLWFMFVLGSLGVNIQRVKSHVVWVSVFCCTLFDNVSFSFCSICSCGVLENIFSDDGNLNKL